MKTIEIQAQALEVSGRKALNSNIGPFDQTLEDVLSFRLFQVQSDAPFTCVEVPPVEAFLRLRVVIKEGTNLPHRVTGWRLDADNIGSKVSH